MLRQPGVSGDGSALTLFPAHQERRIQSSSLLAKAKWNPLRTDERCPVRGCAGVTDPRRAPPYAVCSPPSLPHTLHELAACWWVKGPAEGTCLSHRCQRGAGPASEPLTWRVDRASTRAWSPTLVPHSTPCLLCFSFLPFFGYAARCSSSLWR